MSKYQDNVFNKYVNYIKNFTLPDYLNKYFTDIINEVKKEYDVALKARSKKIDPVDVPESEFTWDMAERIEKMFKLRGLAEVIRQNSHLSREELALFILDELISGKFGIYSPEELLDIGVRLSLAVLTEGMTVAPTEGIKYIKIKESPRGPYVAVYFSGPIRSAGGTEAGLVIVYSDYIRRKLGLNRYIPLERPGDNEVARYIEELRIYERYVGRFQYSVTDEEVAYVVRNIPIEITGVATDDVEVVINRDLSRIETNKVRGGALRVLNDGVIGRARKLYAVISSLKLDEWNWLKEILNKKINNNNYGLVNKNSIGEDKVISEVIIGRPVISLKNNEASFRVRYGRESNMGISAVGIHPAVYVVLDYFLVIGSQIKVNLPGKGAIAVPSSICDPPIVELYDGSVVSLKSEKEARRYKSRIKKILWLGDILISFGDFLENNYSLVSSPYVEEWWYQDLIEALKDHNYSFDPPDIPYFYISFNEALNLSKKLRIPLHPKYTLRWNRLSVQKIIDLLNYLLKSNIRKKDIMLDYDDEIKKILNLLLVEHKIKDNKIIIKSPYYDIFSYLIDRWKRLTTSVLDLEKLENDPIKFISSLMEVSLRDVEGEKISVRLGRPEKVKPRETSPPIHVLFPVGKYGGSQRNLVKAVEKQRYIIVNLSVRFCPNCNLFSYHIFCEKCGLKTIQYKYCSSCKNTMTSNICPNCKQKTMYIRPWTIDLKYLLENNSHKLGYSIPNIIKGVEGLLNRRGIPEALAKGIIRSFHNIHIFKDGTARIDVTNAPLHHFRIKDIHISMEKAKELGYNPKDENDILELYPQDIVIPYSAAKYLVKISKYLDDLLSRLYGIKPYYKIKKASDLIGKLVIGLSPHTSVGIIGRIIGYTNASVLYAHPLWHAAKRRDCDGDEDSVILLLDVLINFSKEFLPSRSGGRMDAPLFINIILQPEEVDTQAHNMDIEPIYSKDFYKMTLKRVSPKDIIKNNNIKTVEKILEKDKGYYGYTSFNYPGQLELKVNTSSYSKLNTMKKKLDKQLKVMNMIFDENTLVKIIRSILTKHILPDIIGNLRSFTSQSYRCKKCNKTHRRPPLNGRCMKCGGELIQTVYPKNIIKYLDQARQLSKYVKDDTYLLNRIALLEKDIGMTVSGIDLVKRKLTDYI